MPPDVVIFLDWASAVIEWKDKQRKLYTSRNTCVLQNTIEYIDLSVTRVILGNSLMGVTFSNCYWLAVDYCMLEGRTGVSAYVLNSQLLKSNENDIVLIYKMRYIWI